MSIWKTYPDISKSAWLEKVAADLKGKNSEDYYQRNPFGTQIEPWYHREDTTHDISIPGRTYDKIHLGCLVVTDDASMGSDYIIDNLAGGCSFLHIIDNTDDNLKSAAEGVHFEMITSVIERNESTASQAFLTELSGDKKLDLLIIDQASFNYKIDLRGTEENLLAEFIRQADEIAQQNEVSHVFCQVEFDHHYINSITSVLALRLIWANICEAYGRSHDNCKLIIEGFISSSIRTSEIHQDLISITQVMTAMFSSDVDVIFPFTSKDDKESRRLIRQAYHVLTMEGHLGKVKAPFQGSYALEKIALDSASQAWTDTIKAI